jgi:hypothetical protein
MYGYNTKIAFGYDKTKQQIANWRKAKNKNVDST